MQKQVSNEPTSCEQEVVLRLESGEKLILNIAPLASLFDHFEMGDPKEFSERFQVLMDRYVETIEIVESGFDIRDFKADYEFLRQFRQAFKLMARKEAESGNGR